MPAAFETRAPASSRHLRSLLLCSVACVWAIGAMADGGSGAAGDVRYGGTAGVDSTTGAGGTGGTPGLNASGGAGAGGGAGVTGGSGGYGVNRTGGTNLTSVPTAPGGAGGASPGANGADGSSWTSTVNGGSGGGGGGGGAHGFVGDFRSSSSNLSGGNGGNGGDGEPTGSNDGGGGGAGGYGAVAQTSIGSINYSISGGRGGAGGSSFIGFGGNGGSGGVGVVPGASLNVSEAGIVRGGAGGNGGNGATNGAPSSSLGGYGAAGGAGIVGSGLVGTSFGTVIGGNGGNGGNGGVRYGTAGNGAVGGAGYDGTGGSLTNYGTLTGGNGGFGGNGGADAGKAGSGGAGGVGVIGSGTTAMGAAVINYGVITGGNGGAAGTVGRTAGTAGAGGVGVTASNFVVAHRGGTISGGLSADGVTRANAISFTGGTNLLELWAGASIVGKVKASSTADILRLAGASNGTFDMSNFGADAQYSGFGRLEKYGASTWTLTGTSATTAPIGIYAGRLAVNGALANAPLRVFNGGTLAGNGTVGETWVQSGGIVAPGNSIGTLRVNGNLVLEAGSTYAAELGANGASDRIVVSGTAAVTGSNVSITGIDPQGTYKQGQRYTLLTATGGINGNFAAVTSFWPFLNVALDPRTGDLGITVSAKPFGTAALTRNQLTTAGGLDSLPQVGGTLALYNSLLILDADSGRAAFDQLSGEIHASAQTVLVEESASVRAAAIDRLRSAFGTVGSAAMATMNYGFSADLAPSAKGPMPKLAPAERFAVWGQGYGSWGRIDSDRNAASVSRSTGGLMLGADMAVLDNLRIGVLAGYSHSEFDSNGRLSSGESDNYHLGVYGGGQWGALGVRLGASYTWHDVSTQRTVAFGGFGDSLRGDYDAGTAQVFGEVGYRFDVGRIALEPFAGLAYVNLQTDGVREIGGAAALSGRGDDTSVGYSTLGLRASTSFALQGMDLTLRGALGWRHAFGDVDPAATLAFSGGNTFTVAGLPIAKNAALVEAGLDLAIGKNTTLGVSYTGQLATDAQDHTFKANLAVRF